MARSTCVDLGCNEEGGSGEEDGVEWSVHRRNNTISSKRATNLVRRPSLIRAKK